MSIDSAIFLFRNLLAFSLMIQTLEYIAIARRQNIQNLWDWSIQRDDLRQSNVFIRYIFDSLYREPIHKSHLILRLSVILSFFYDVTIASSLFIFISTLVLVIRWRGAFNGGSDYMTVVAVTGLFIGTIGSTYFQSDGAWKAALFYVAIHSMTSYFMSGAVKLLNSHWRSGTALVYFLDGGLYGPLAPHSVFRIGSIARLASWAFILWEISFPLALLASKLMIAYCAIAFLFHLLVFRYFGLNRFVWAWSATFPALIYCASLLQG